MKYAKLSDSGHGWLGVPNTDLDELGIANDISEFSYQASDGIAWLEEDYDMHVFLQARRQVGRPVPKQDICKFSGEGDSWIRDLPWYKADKEAAA